MVSGDFCEHDWPGSGCDKCKEKYMTDEERIEASNVRYMRAMHSVQCAVQYEMESGKSNASSPKQLRTGINSCMVTDAGLGELLISKGIITLVEYHEALAKAAENEAARFHALHPGITFV